MAGERHFRVGLKERLALNSWTAGRGRLLQYGWAPPSPLGPEEKKTAEEGHSALSLSGGVHLPPPSDIGTPGF